jgi:hypothetical protein
MMAWLPIVILAVVQIAVRLIGVAGMIWRERARAQANCEHMRTAAASGVLLIEHRENGRALLIAPHGSLDRGKDTESGAAGSAPEEASAL